MDERRVIARLHAKKISHWLSTRPSCCTGCCRPFLIRFFTDGATALLVCTREFAEKHGLTLLSKVKSFAVSGCAPGIMGMGPVESSRKAMARAGLTIDDIDIVEMNEAFAAQAEACRRELGISEERLNIDGGALALGHPLGATGGRLVGKASLLLQRESGRYALATQCIGGGMGIAMILEAA